MSSPDRRPRVWLRTHDRETPHLHRLKSDSRPCPRDHLCGRQHPVHPLRFWFCNPGPAPAPDRLQYHGSRSPEFRDASELVVFEDPNYT
jgi:hypothetical protein